MEGEPGFMGMDGWKVKAWRVVECSRAQHRGNSGRGDVLRQLIKSRLKRRNSIQTR